MNRTVRNHVLNGLSQNGPHIFAGDNQKILDVGWVGSNASGGVSVAIEFDHCAPTKQTVYEFKFLDDLKPISADFKFVKVLRLRSGNVRYLYVRSHEMPFDAELLDIPTHSKLPHRQGAFV